MTIFKVPGSDGKGFKYLTKEERMDTSKEKGGAPFAYSNGNGWSV